MSIFWINLISYFAGAISVLIIFLSVKKMKTVKDDEIILTIDYNKTIEQTIADGNYDRVNSNITAENFPVPQKIIGKKVKVFAKLFHFNRNISSDDAILEMNKAGYRPATLMELLTLGILFPELQRKFSIVALGSIRHRSNNYRDVPYLYTNDSRRKLDLYWFNNGSCAYYSFLGVRYKNKILT